MLQVWNAIQLAVKPLPEDSALIRFADSTDLLVTPVNQPVAILDIVCGDICNNVYGLSNPSKEDAKRILKFHAEHNHHANFVVQCQAGVGRSIATAAALSKVNGLNPSKYLGNGTYNHALYKYILEAAGLTVEPEALVSMVVRLKYNTEYALAFELCMRRQTYENWELIFVGDGLSSSYQPMDVRTQVIHTKETKGKWGHPYRQLGIDAAQGKYIGLSNDDNYYVPGYIEQMVRTLETYKADLALCLMLHRYKGWSVLDGNDVGNWIAERKLVKQFRWFGYHFTADQDYLKALVKAARRPMQVKHPLAIKN